jgi:phospholipid transport system substrate-binding protein
MENPMPSIRPSSRSWLAVALATCAAALGFSDAARAEVVAPAVSAPVRVVEKLHAALLGVMKDAEKLGYEGRVERLAPVLTETYDTSFMAEKSVGRHWKQASPADQAELVATFSRFMISNYAGRFDGYSGQSFQTLGEEPSAQGTVLVRTRLLDPGDEGVQLDYRLRETAGNWKIVDVYLNGTVSELALRRSEYVSLIKRDGWQGLISALDDRIATLAAAPADRDLN